MTLGERIKEARQRKGLTQEQLARRAGLTLNATGEIERGISPNPHLQSLMNIAAALDVPVSALLGEEAEVAPLAGAPSSSPEETGAEASPLVENLFDREQLQGYEQGDLLDLKNELLDEYRELHPGPRTKEDFFRPETPEERVRMDRFIVVSANLSAVLSVLEETAGRQHT